MNFCQIAMKIVKKLRLTFNMSKCAECTSGTIAGVLYIVTFGRFVDFRMKLLLSPRMAILAGITGLAADRVAPLVARLDIGTGSGSVKAHKHFIKLKSRYHIFYCTMRQKHTFYPEIPLILMLKKCEFCQK